MELRSTWLAQLSIAMRRAKVKARWCRKRCLRLGIATAQYLGRTDPESVESLMKRVAALERQVKKLAQLVTN
jgi:hypothetical protein